MRKTVFLFNQNFIILTSHVSKSSVNASLGSNGVGSRREEFGNTPAQYIGSPLVILGIECEDNPNLFQNNYYMY